MNPRESMRTLPRAVQPYLTWMTGVPLAGSRLRISWRPGSALIAGFGQSAAGVAFGVYSLTQAWYLAVPMVLIAWPITAGGLRRLDVVVVHQTLHKMFTGSSRGNRVVSEIVTTLLWRAAYDDNRKEHLLHHAFPCSMRDGDTLYLLSTGARAGMTTRQFRSYLLRAVVSPKHHWSFISNRIRANLFTRLPLYRQVMAWGYLLGTVALLAATGWWKQWLLAWLVPLTLFFQSQTLLYTLSEHRWWLFDNAERLTKSQRDQLTFGRFCGELTPRVVDGAALKVAAWMRWWLRVFFIYTPYRMCILVGDTVQHDLHHVRPKCDWANSSWVRSEDLSTPEAGRYTEAWGGLLSHVYVGNSVQGWSAVPSLPTAMVG